MKKMTRLLANDVHTALVVTTSTSIILTSSKVQNGDILVLAYPGRPGKRPLNESFRVTLTDWSV